MNFNLVIPAQVTFGQGCSLQAGEKLLWFNCKKVMCLYDEGIKNAGIVDPIVQSMKDTGLELVIFDKVLPDPPDYVCEEAAKIAEEENVDGFVAIGGGSTIDTAKAANFLVVNKGTTFAECQMNFYHTKNQGKPLIAIPTTAGTGSEVTTLSIVTNTKPGLEVAVNQKVAVIEKGTCSTAALIDPLLFLGSPVGITVAAAMDALSHNLESCTTNFSTPFLDSLSYKGIELCFQNLPKVLENNRDVDAWENLCLAAMIGGIVACNAFAHMAHAVGQGLQAVFHMYHGTACAIGLPLAIEAVAEVFPEKIKLIGKSMGVDVPENVTPKEAGNMVSQRMQAFLKQIGSPTLKELNVDKSKLEEAVPLIITEDAYNLSPVQPSGDEVMAYLLRIYGD